MVVPWTVPEMIEATGGRLTLGNAECLIARISTDTRQLQAGDCFVALTGENFDGHDFVQNAIRKGAIAVVVSRRHEDIKVDAWDSVSVLEVQDTLYALGELARRFRQRFRIPVVGITGSNGKTSTKEMLASILSGKREVLKNKGNFNNLIGVPLTLLSLGPQHEVAVVEMGINIPGEMERLAEITSPTVGLITNIHPAHLEGLHSLDNILREKTRLWMRLRAEDLAVVNMDDDRLSGFVEKIRAHTLTYSLRDPSALVRLDGEVRQQNGRSQFYVAVGGKKVEVHLNVLGMHQVQNAVAAAAVAWGMGESPESIVEGLSKHRPVFQRMQAHPLPDGGTLIDDTYNANPQSMIAAVRAAIFASKDRPLVVVLGEMRELGEESPSLHREVGLEIGKLGVTSLITLGDLAAEIAKGAREAGMQATACYHACSHKEIVDWLFKRRPEGAWVLVKGSRGMKMEAIIKEFLAQ